MSRERNTQMPKVLCRDECYALVGEHPDDRCPTTFSFWSSTTGVDRALEEHRDKFPELNANVITTHLYYEIDHTGKRNYYTVNVKPVVLNPLSREQILAKLSDEELSVLGITR